jgi:hypothetical protein
MDVLRDSGLAEQHRGLQGTCDKGADDLDHVCGLDIALQDRPVSGRVLSTHSVRPTSLHVQPGNVSPYNRLVPMPRFACSKNKTRLWGRRRCPLIEAACPACLRTWGVGYQQDQGEKPATLLRDDGERSKISPRQYTTCCRGRGSMAKTTYSLCKESLP